MLSFSVLQFCSSHGFSKSCVRSESRSQKVENWLGVQHRAQKRQGLKVRVQIRDIKYANNYDYFEVFMRNVHFDIDRIWSSDVDIGSRFSILEVS